MLLTFVVAYLAVSIALGLVAAMKVHSARDYITAGRHLPIWVVFATVFATWFGAETVLAVSATFAKDGLHGIPGDPFGASVCLVLAALLFARLFYRMNLLTIGDFYKHRYGKVIEVLTSVAIVASYLGWTSAQMTALGLVIHVLSGGAVELNNAILMGAGVVLVYTIFGGMWSVAFTDLFQTVVIVVGLTLVFFYAAARPRFGPGPRTAIIVAVALWIGGYVLSLLGYQLMGLFPPRLLVLWGGIGLVEMILAGLVGGRLYREPEPAP